MEITPEYLMNKLREYREAEAHYTKMAAANTGAAEAITNLLTALTTADAAPTNVVPFSAPQNAPDAPEEN